MEDIDRYKTSLIKLWKQSCANASLKITHTSNIYDIQDKVLKFNIKDNYINDLIIKSLINVVQIDWTNYSMKDSSYHFTIEKKKLSIVTMYVDVITHNSLYFVKEKIEKSMFSKDKTVNVDAWFYLNSEHIVNINRFLLNKSNNLVGCVKKERSGDYNTKLKLEIRLLSYNNIFIPITYAEYEELRCFELECRKKDDMEDVYRNLTLLSPSEYKEFIMWKESQRVYNDIDTEKNLENAE